MTEDELRVLVREVIASRVTPQPDDPLPVRLSASHARLGMVVPTVPGSPCIIEPNVGCNQCGYCVSLGH
jgi:hypothetical protein